MRSGLSYLLSRPELHTVEIDGGALRCVPTPTVGDSRGSRNATPWRSANAGPHNAGVTLTDYVTMYPTPTATEYGRKKSASKGAAVRESLQQMARSGNWPTPTAQDAKNSTLPASQVCRDSVPGALLRAGHTGKLNPEFVEWLMGCPIGWTDCEPLGMGRSPHNSCWLGVICGPKRAPGGCSSRGEAAR